jgi:hypothetical protein
VCSSEEPTELVKYFYQKVVVVEVMNGESQEEAWRRHLLTKPGDAAAKIKIFHYLHPTPL